MKNATMVYNQIQEGLKSKLDAMNSNYARAEWLAASFKEAKLSEDLQEPIIIWFLANY
ncbi:hypothetical protein [Cellulosilyticum sp. WCF-2]|uniref:hypothetical protein n=1 Tax=Cellulosilyticum sp. WCF-2 TaxID=2497860 RepID=UPI00168064AD|nr:hypothetical protein [Cellulosilyticum sp. WCF-2]